MEIGVDRPARLARHRDFPVPIRRFVHLRDGSSGRPCGAKSTNRSVQVDAALRSPDHCRTMVFGRSAPPADEEARSGLLPSRRQLKRWRQRAVGLLAPATQGHVVGVRGSVAELRDGSIEIGSALLRQRGPRSRSWNDHGLFRLWFEGKAEPRELTAHMRRLLRPQYLDTDLLGRLVANDDNGLTVAEEYADRAITTRAGQRLPIIRLVKRRFMDRERVRKPSPCRGGSSPTLQVTKMPISEAR
jgi:hypothetical protein